MTHDAPLFPLYPHVPESPSTEDGLGTCRFCKHDLDLFGPSDECPVRLRTALEETRRRRHARNTKATPPRWIYVLGIAAAALTALSMMLAS